MTTSVSSPSPAPADGSPLTLPVSLNDVIAAVQAYATQAAAAKDQSLTNVTSTAADRVAVNADRIASDSNAAATAADRYAVGVDRAATDTNVTTSAANATAAAGSASAAAINKAATDTNVATTAANVTTTNTNVTASAANATAAAGSASTAATNKAATDTNVATTAANVTTTNTNVTTSAANATAAAGSLTAINSAIASANSIPSALASPFTLDGRLPSAIISIEKGLFSLNGAIVPYSSLFTVSSATKYTVGPDGNYILNAANSPAYDWSTGRKKQLIETNATTNYWLNSEAPTPAYLGGQFSVTNTANSLFGILNRALLTATSAGGVVNLYPAASVNGDSFTFTAALRNGTGSWVQGGIYVSSSGWGADADSSCAVVSGPGAVTRASGGLFNFTGLSSTVDTVVRFSRTMRATDSVGVYLYSNCAIGQTVSMGTPQLEKKAMGSSYVPCGASATTRAADVVTSTAAFNALLNSADSTVAIRGKNITSSAPYIIPLGSSTGGGIFFNGYAVATCSFWNHGQASGLGIPLAAASRDFGICVGASQNGRKGAANGGAIGSDTLGNSWAAEAYFNLGNYATTGLPTNMLFDELVVWPFYGSNTGVQAQARIYT